MLQASICLIWIQKFILKLIFRAPLLRYILDKFTYIDSTVCFHNYQNYFVYSTFRIYCFSKKEILYVSPSLEFHKLFDQKTNYALRVTYFRFLLHTKSSPLNTRVYRNLMEERWFLVSGKEDARSCSATWQGMESSRDPTDDVSAYTSRGNYYRPDRKNARWPCKPGSALTYYFLVIFWIAPATNASNVFVT